MLDMTDGPIICLIIVILATLLLVATNIIFIDKKIWIKIVSWVAFGVVVVTTLNFSKPYPGNLKVFEGQAEKTEVLTIEHGQIQGLYNKDKSVEAYAGIPFAKPPVGDLRWKEPQDLEDWEGVKDCTYFASKAMQKPSNAIFDNLALIYAGRQYVPDFSYHDEQKASEDCLYLNLWKPAGDANNLPVLVFIHGGSLTDGTAAFRSYNGESMAKTGVIMITIAYRLNVFGYFAHPDLKEESPNHTTGNYGLLDQIKALEWVRDNIEYFGGDKNNVTIAGESAGSSSVSAICASPLAHGLFKRAIGESSSIVIKTPPHTFRTYDKAIETGKNIMKEFKCNSIDELRKISADKLVNTQHANNSMTVDGYALPKTPYEIYEEGNNNEEALLNGCNALEADAFVIPQFLMSGQPQTNKSNILKRISNYIGEDAAKKVVDFYNLKTDNDAFLAYSDFLSCWWFIYPHHCWNRALVNNGKTDIYRYYFDKDNRYYRSNHSGEMVYAYGNVRNDERKYRFNQSDYELSDTMLSYWSNFAKTGDPNGEGLPTWSKWSEAENKVQRLGVTVEPIEDKYKGLYDIFDEYCATIS